MPNPNDAARAAYEYKLMQKALDAKMPILGVCAGMQRLNVLCGGTLHQHIPDMLQHGEHMQIENYNIAPFIPVEPIQIHEGTALSSIADEIKSIFARGHVPNPPGVVEENSMHHQAVDKVGNGLKVSATAIDKLPGDIPLIEAVEADPAGPYANQFLIGVQWHPEFSASPLGAKLAQHVAAAATQFAQQTGREHTWEDVQHENIISSLPYIKLPTPDDSTMQAQVGSKVAQILATRIDYERTHALR